MNTKRPNFHKSGKPGPHQRSLGRDRDPAVSAPAGPGLKFRGGGDVAILWGYRAVLEALRSPRRRVLRIIATSAAADKLGPEIEARDLTPVIVSQDELSRALPREAVHQGVALEAQPLETLDLSDLPDEGTVLILDQVTDPHNVGAILRSAAAFGVTALITTERHTPAMTGVVAKSASGALEHVPVVAVVNLARALEELARRGFRLIGLDSDGSLPLDAVEPAAAQALVLGAEGRGLRRLTRERCDVVARLDMPGPIRSLNVSNACAVALTVLRMRADTSAR